MYRLHMVCMLFVQFDLGKYRLDRLVCRGTWYRRSIFNPLDLFPLFRQTPPVKTTENMAAWAGDDKQFIDANKDTPKHLVTIGNNGVCG